MKKLWKGYNLGTTEVDYVPRFEWKDEAGVPTFWILNGKTNIAYNKPRPYLGFNLVLAETMGWVVKKEDDSYGLGPNLLMHPLLDEPKNPKIDVAADKNQLVTFTDYVHVYRGIVYLSMVVDWQFVNLDEAYAKATTNVYVPPKVLSNEFRWIMDDASVWTKDGGISSLGFVSLEGSPHYWKKKTLGMTLTKSGTKYQPYFSWLMDRMFKNNWHKLIVEMYTTDNRLFDHTQVTFLATSYVQIGDTAVTTHVHEYHGTHMVYYHRLVADFRLMPVGASSHSYRVYVKVTMDQVPSSYPATLTDQFYVVAYGYPIVPQWPRVDEVDDVYDDHPVIRRSTTTTTTSSSTTESTTTPTHPGSKETQKKTTVTHRDQVSRPVHLYCNVGESSIVGNQITNFLRDLPYKDDPIRWEPQHVQYHRVRGHTVEIVEVEVAEKNGTFLNLNPAGETQVMLHFKA